MKKQVALVVAALSALFSLCAPAEGSDCGWMCERCIFAYRLSLTLNTTQPFRESNVAAGGELIYRKPAICKFVGYFFGRTAYGAGVCGDTICSCNDWWIGDDGHNLNGVIVLWKAWNKKVLPVEGLTINRMNRIGYADRSTVESVMTLKLTDQPGLAAAAPELVLAGFGKAGHLANGKVAIKNLSGFFAGQMLTYCVDGGENVCGDPLPETWTPSAYWELCDDNDEVAVSDNPLTAAYGKWQMAWDSQLLARFAKNGVNADTARPTAAYERAHFEWD